jgi:hypothetical protein
MICIDNNIILIIAQTEIMNFTNQRAPRVIKIILMITIIKFYNNRLSF